MGYILGAAKVIYQAVCPHGFLVDWISTSADGRQGPAPQCEEHEK